MYCVRKVNEDYTWIGADSRRLAVFEGVLVCRRAFPITATCCWMKKPCSLTRWMPR